MSIFGKRTHIIEENLPFPFTSEFDLECGFVYGIAYHPDIFIVRYLRRHTNRVLFLASHRYHSQHYT